MANDQMARTGQTDETDRLISSDKVDGTTVYNRNGETLGTIDHLMIDKFTGQVEFAVMSQAVFSASARTIARCLGTRWTMT